MESTVQPGLQPFIKLVQSNFATFTEFWLSPDLIWQPFSGAQRTLGTQNPITAPAPSEALSRLVKGLLENYSRFFVEASQGGIALWGRSVSGASPSALS